MLDASGGCSGCVLFASSLRVWFDRQLILWPDKPAFDPQVSGAVDTDEGAGAADVLGIEYDRTIVEGGERRLDFAKALINLLGKLIGLGVGLLKAVHLGLKGVASGLLLCGERHRLPAKLPQTIGVAIGEVGSDLDPLPAFGADRLGAITELVGYQPVEQADVLQPAAIVALEQVAHDDAAGVGVRGDADELGALVGGADGAFGQHSPDGVRFLGVGLAKPLEYLFLAFMVGVDGERHELVERHSVVGVDVEQLGRDRRQSQTLLHDGHGHEKRGGDLLLGLAFVAQGLECAELVEGVKRRALDILGEAILLGDAAFTNDTRDWRRLGQALLLHQEFQRPIAAAASGNLEHAGFVALGVANRPHRDALQQGATGDVLGQLLDRDAGLDPPHVGLTEQELVERDIPGRTEDDLLNLSHGHSP